MFLLLYCITDKSFTGIDHMSQQVNVLPFEPGFIFDSLVWYVFLIFLDFCVVFLFCLIYLRLVSCVSVSHKYKSGQRWQRNVVSCCNVQVIFSVSARDVPIGIYMKYTKVEIKSSFVLYINNLELSLVKREPACTYMRFVHLLF
jgi:hypothetical protein